MERSRTFEPRATKRIRKRLVLVNTGNGKGKTTAALGVLMRAWGRDMKVAMLQFVKKKTGNWGESRDAPPQLIDDADLATEMRLVKHPYDDQGIKAPAGIEF